MEPWNPMIVFIASFAINLCIGYLVLKHLNRKDPPGHA